MIKVAMLSKWHVHAAEYAQAVLGSGKAVITCVWDEDAARGEAWAKELGAEFVADLDALLARSDVEAVVVDTPTTMHRDVMVKAAKAGKHIFTEKALAPTVAECEEIRQAVVDAGVKFVISFPHRTFPRNIYAKQALDQGLLGKVNFLRIRNAHGGSSDNWLPAYWYESDKTAGGAMMDLGCHPMYLASYFLGQPKRISSMYNRTCAPGDMEDNAVSTIEFENGAIAVLETGFITPYSPSGFELLGTEGALVLAGDTLRLRSRKLGVDGWIEPDLPAKGAMAMNQWLSAIQTGEPILFGIDDAVKLTQLLENAYISHREGRTVDIG